MWPRIKVEGGEWEVRIVSSAGSEAGAQDEVIEFRPAEATRPPRRLVVPAGSASEMSMDELRAAFVRARPIGGDHYGRPGKRMSDI